MGYDLTDADAARDYWAQPVLPSGMRGPTTWRRWPNVSMRH